MRGLYFCAIIIFVTYYGDGEYEDQFGNSYGVDAGMIGLASTEWCIKNEISLSDFVVATFDQPTQCTADTSTGTLTFGKYIIETGDNGDEEEFIDCTEEETEED